MVTLALACSDPGDITRADSIVTINGPLRLTVTDTLGVGGVLFAKPVATAAPAKLTVTNTRYGSLCRYDVLGQADISASAITLRITFSERLTLCTEEIRTLTYRADISSLSPNEYDLRVIHIESGKQDTLLVQRVTVP